MHWWVALSAGHQSDRMLPQVRPSLGYPLGGYSKRGLDLVIAAGGLILLLPMLAMVALLTRILVGGPLLRRQVCVGFAGRSFDRLSFNTTVDAPRGASSVALARALRRSGLAHAPQLWNVLRGDMSCVGPRPLSIAEVAQGDASGSSYLGERPGMTGAWLLPEEEGSAHQSVDSIGTIGGDVSILIKILRSSGLPSS